MCRRLSNDGVRYIWLSTPEKSGGLNCGSPLHFAACDNFLLQKPILVTEGALKAATAANFFSKTVDVLANARINCSHEEIVAAARFRPILIAFDADYYENCHVARAFARLLNLIFGSMKGGFQNRVKILTRNSEFKGIDDALLQNASINSLSPSE